MLPALKAEFRKLTTVRSTYVIIILALLLTLFFAGYVEGFKADKSLLQNPGHLANEVTGALGVIAIFCGLIAILLFSHEYRYNTILHTLTSAGNRSMVLVAKILTMTGFAALFALCIGILSPLFSYLGIQLAGHELVAQSIPYSDLLWRGLFVVWGYSMIGLLLVALTRNQVVSVAIMLLVPTTIEGIATLLLKSDAVYMPFSALTAVLTNNPDITHKKAALVFLTYIISAWITAWILFLRRDAINNRS